MRTCLEQRRRRALAARHGRLGRVERAHQHQRLAALRRIEIDVATRHREPVRLAHDRRADDLDVEQQVAGQAANHLELLEVLLAEDRDVGPRGDEELRHHGRDAAEEMRPRAAAERLAEFAHLDAGLGAVGIQLGRVGREDGIDTGRATLREIRIEVRG